MATRLPTYRMRDGKTRLGEGYFNPIWTDIDGRLDTLERIRINWEAAVAQLREVGLKRIDEYIRPLIDEVNDQLLQARDETDGLAQALVTDHIQPKIDQVDALLQQAQEDLDAFAQQQEAFDDTYTKEQIDQRIAAGIPDWPVQMAYNVNGDLTTATYSKGDQRIRQTLSYNAEGDLATVLIEDSVDAGVNWSELGIQTLNYDAEGNLTHTEWMGNA